MARKLVVEIVGDASSLHKTFRQAGQSTEKFEREMSRTVRGVAAGSGVFKSLGRSLAFASGGFVAAAGITDVLRGSITQATEAAKVQGQLAAQFKASGQDLGRYQQRIDETSNKLSVLAGIENDEVKAAFVTAFRGTNNVTTSLKIQAIAADVARARNISLATATLALTKAFGGQSTALRRLGILVPATLHGMNALNFVQQKFAGQAKAGTTSQERFTAAFKNMEEAIGTALLPTFNELLGSMTKWLAKSENQKRVQEDTKKTVGFFGQLLHVTKEVAGGFKQGYDAVDTFGKKSRALNAILEKNLKGFISLGNAAKKTGEDIAHAAVTGGAFAPITGEDVAHRGAGARTGGGRAARGVVRPRASLDYQMSLLQERLAKAELTASTKDDRAVLLRLKVLTSEKITKTKDLAARIALLASLGQYDQQIQAIDAKTAADRKDARQKELDARKKEVAAAKLHAEKLKEQAAKLRALEKQRQQRALARLTVAQFRQLGLGPSGADVIPGGRQLLKRLGKVQDAVKGTVLDTKENRKLLERIRHTLVDGLGKLAPEVRSKIEQLLDALDLQDAAKKRGKKPCDFGRRDFGHGFGGLGEFAPSGLTRLGTPAGMPIPKPLTEAQLPARLQVNTMNIHLHGVQNVRQLEDELVKRTKSRAHTRRGP